MAKKSTKTAGKKPKQNGRGSEESRTLKKGKYCDEYAKTGVMLPRRRWFQFSLRTLLVVVTLVAGLLVAWRVYVEPYRRQRETERILAQSESTLLSTFRMKYPALPTTVNRRPTHRVIVTLKPGKSVGDFFRSIYRRHRTQQWCLMPQENGGFRLGLDTTGDKPGDLIRQLSRSDLVADVKPGDDSVYLTEVLDDCRWRNVSYFGPFVLLAAHIIKGSKRRDVERLVGKPTKTLPEGNLRHYCNSGGRSAGWIVVEYKGDRVVKSIFKTVLRGGPHMKK